MSERPTWQGTAGPKALKELNLTKNNANLEIDPSRNAGLWETLRQRFHLRCAWIPDPQELWGDKCVCVTLLRYKVIRYTEVDNHFTRHITNYLKCKPSKLCNWKTDCQTRLKKRSSSMLLKERYFKYKGTDGLKVKAGKRFIMQC